MPCLIGEATSALDFDALIAALVVQCPEARVIEPDYYAARIGMELEITQAMGLPPDNPIVECAREASRQHGLTRQIRVRLNDGTELIGTVSRTGFLLSCKASLTTASVGPIMTALGDFPEVRTKTLGVDRDGAPLQDS